MFHSPPLPTQHHHFGADWPTFADLIPLWPGFAITGKAGSTGYLQRIAVHPKMQQLGIGRQLVDDALKWLIRRGTSRALVNTGVDNFSALAMYERASFERLGDELVILEHRQKP